MQEKVSIKTPQKVSQSLTLSGHLKTFKDIALLPGIIFAL